MSDPTQPLPPSDETSESVTLPTVTRMGEVRPEHDGYQPPVRATAHVSVKQSRDRAQYVRQQKGHSFILHWFVLGVFSMFIVPIYYSVSPNHYWHI